ncbi:MAG: Ig-like domain-containing protein [Mesorhizobium sp.]
MAAGVSSALAQQPGLPNAKLRRLEAVSKLLPVFIGLEEMMLKTSAILSISTLSALFFVTAADAACSGSNGRGWGSGGGSGKFTMSASDKTCRIGMPGFINDAKKTNIPASQVKFTRNPSSGKVSVGGSAMTYTPNPGFKGSDRFCTVHTSPKVKGQKLSGCITVTVK